MVGNDAAYTLRRAISLLLLKGATAFCAVTLPPVLPRSDAWQAGLHYSVLVPAHKLHVASGKIEVLELFMYTSPISREIQPYIDHWLKHKAAYIEFVREPAIVFPHARLQARLYYTLKDLGREDLQNKVFDWVFDPAHYPAYHTIAHPDENAYLSLNTAFANVNGLDVAGFERVCRSSEMDDRVIKAEIDTHGYYVNGTSTFVVNGKYSTSIQRLMLIAGKAEITSGEYAKLFELIDYLGAWEAKNLHVPVRGLVRKPANPARIPPGSRAAYLRDGFWVAARRHCRGGAGAPHCP